MSKLIKQDEYRNNMQDSPPSPKEIKPKKPKKKAAVDQKEEGLQKKKTKQEGTVRTKTLIDIELDAGSEEDEV